MLCTLVASVALAAPAGAATLHRYATGVSAMAGGGHRVGLTAPVAGQLRTRVIDERTGTEIRSATPPSADCHPDAIGGGWLAYGCEYAAALVSIADGSVHHAGVSEYTNADRTRVEAVGTRRLLL
jgi:hypothetical protein